MSVILSDNGGIANGGVDTYVTQTFTITVTAVNNAPSFTKGLDQSVLEDIGTRTVLGWATAISAGAANESTQTLIFTVSNDNTLLFSTQPSIDATGNSLRQHRSNGLATVT